MAKYVLFSSVSSLPGFDSLLEKGLVSNDKRTLLVKKHGVFTKLPVEMVGEFEKYVAKFAPVSPVPAETVVSTMSKHFTPTDANFNKTPMSQMKIGSKGITAGIVLANSKGAGFYMHSIASLSNILYREDSIQGKDRDSIIKLLSYANKHFLSMEQYNTAINTLKEIYKGKSSDLCKRIIKTLWVNFNL